MQIDNKILTRVVRIATITLFASAFCWRCANITSPQGGPKDSLAPIIVSAEPFFNSVEFNGKEIHIGFNEYVQIKDQQKEFFTSPPMKRNPQITTIGKGIRITILDTLKEDQTYSLNFGSSIVDNNEGNILSDFRYVFSTGSTIDSMVMSGYTVSASKGDSVSKTMIFFYPEEVCDTTRYDSTLLKLQPSAVARAASNGIFVAQNLKPINYRVYAFQDNNNNFVYDPETDMVGFLDSARNPLTEPDFSVWYDTTRHYLTANPQLYFKMFTDKRFKRQTLAEAKRDEQHRVTLYFGAPNPAIQSIVFDSIAAEDVVTEYVTRGRDTINYWLHVPSESLPDTLKGELIYMKHDSVNNFVPDTVKLALFWKYFESKEEKKAREEEEKKMEQALKDSVEYVPPVKPNPFGVEAPSGELNPEHPITLKFAMPLVRVDTAALKLYLVGDAEAEKGGGAAGAAAGQKPVAQKPAADQKPEGGPAAADQKPEGEDVAAAATPAAEGEGQQAAQPVEENLPEVDFSLERDTVDMKKWHVRAEWQTGKKYRLLIPAGAFENVASQQNDTIKNDYTTLVPDKFGSVVVNVSGKSPESSYVIYLCDENGKRMQEVRHAKSGSYTFNYIKPGNVRISVLEDTNDNGEWDTGDLIWRRQPERTEPYVDDKGEEIIAVKANWEVEVGLDMNQIFAPITFEMVNEQLRKTEAVRLEKILEDRAKKRREAAEKEQNKGGGLGGFSSGMSSMRGAVSSAVNNSGSSHRY